MKDINEMTLEELTALAEAVSAKIAEITGEEKPEVTEATRSLMDGLTNNADELNKMVDAIIARKQTISDIIEKRKAMRSAVASGAVGTKVSAFGEKTNAKEERAKKFVETKRDTVEGELVRSVLVSGGTLATPTEVQTEINDMAGVRYSTLLDYVKVENCVGMACDRVPVITADAGEAAAQTEGQAATGKEPTFSYVDLTPTSVAVSAQISKQAKKQTPVRYRAKVEEQALVALKKKAVSLAVTAIKASSLNQEVVADVSGGYGVIDETTLRKIAFNYGGNEAIVGGATLLLNKTDLIAFGDVRGDNEKGGVYEITPNGQNPNIGTIKDGGLTVNYLIVNGLTACAGTAQTSAKIPTMFYGDLKAAVQLDLFSDYEIRVSEDFAFTSLLDTIVGDVELDVDVVQKNGLIAYTIPATT